MQLTVAIHILTPIVFSYSITPNSELHQPKGPRPRAAQPTGLILKKIMPPQGKEHKALDKSRFLSWGNGFIIFIQTIFSEPLFSKSDSL